MQKGAGGLVESTVKIELINSADMDEKSEFVGTVN